jgi:2-polyprenyl-3-methyl-5-hydroxy-6-metoxy-1,4-benzoquinol methylase
MFLRVRTTQAEYCDRPDLPDADLAASYHHLGRLNRVMVVADPFRRLLVRWLGREHVTRLTVLDLGAGDASLGAHLEQWAAQRGWHWRVTSLDGSVRALRLGQAARRVAGNVCELPFADESFDVVMASQMTHHLTEEETVRHFREAWRVSRDVLFLTDTHRNIGSLAAIWTVLKLMGVPAQFLSDGMISIRRGWRVPEWQRLAREAGIPNGRVSVYYGSRIFLQARKRAERAE